MVELFSDVSVNGFAKFDIDQSSHVTHTTGQGDIIVEGILTRLAEDDVRLSDRTRWSSH